MIRLVFYWVLSGVSGAAITLGFLVNEEIVNQDIRNMRAWFCTWFYQELFVPFARWVIYLKNETAVPWIAFTACLFYGVHFLLKWRQHEEERLEKLEEESPLA